jgi:hypothetical protein
MKKLGQASAAEQNAAFDAVHGDLLNLITNWVPMFFQSQARAKLESKEGRVALLKLVDDALEAAEKVRSGGEK